MEVFLYRFLLYLHLLLVILYLGPSLGGSFVYWRARRSRNQTLTHFVLLAAKKLYDFEHLTLVAVILSGIGLLWLGRWDPLAPGWLRNKLLVVAFLLLPVEVWDVVVVNGRLAPELRRLESAWGENGVTGLEGRQRNSYGQWFPPLSSRVLRAHELVLTWGGVLFVLAVLAVLWLSVAK